MKPYLWWNKLGRSPATAAEVRKQDKQAAYIQNMGEVYQNQHKMAGTEKILHVRVFFGWDSWKVRGVTLLFNRDLSQEEVMEKVGLGFNCQVEGKAKKEGLG